MFNSHVTSSHTYGMSSHGWSLFFWSKDFLVLTGGHYIKYMYIYIYKGIYIYIYIYTLDSWKFRILLLYILWDDWLIFMISGSNEQLQQQLEYTLLKPDCHSWGIPKMQSDILEERYAIKFCFKTWKKWCHRNVWNASDCFEWHKKFKEARESVRDNERCGRSKEVNTPQLIGQRVRVRVTMLRF